MRMSCQRNTDTDTDTDTSDGLSGKGSTPNNSFSIFLFFGRTTICNAIDVGVTVAAIVG